MLLIEAGTALLMAVLIGTIAALVLAKKEREFDIPSLFVLIFLCAWAGGLWFSPFGPALIGVFWMPFMLAGLVIAVIALFVSPKRPPRNRRETIEYLERSARTEELKQATAVSLKLYARLLMALLIAVIVIRYITSR